MPSTILLAAFENCGRRFGGEGVSHLFCTSAISSSCAPYMSKRVPKQLKGFPYECNVDSDSDEGEGGGNLLSIHTMSQAYIRLLRRFAPTFSLTPRFTFWRGSTTSDVEDDDAAPADSAKRVEFSLEEAKSILSELSVVRELTLVETPYITGEFARWICQHLPHLVDLNVFVCSSMRDAADFCSEMLLHRSLAVREDVLVQIRNFAADPADRKHLIAHPSLINSLLMIIGAIPAQNNNNNNNMFLVTPSGMNPRDHYLLVACMYALAAMMPENNHELEEDDNDMPDPGQFLAKRIAGGSTPERSVLAPAMRVCKTFMQHECSILRVAACKFVQRYLNCYRDIDTLVQLQLHIDVVDHVAQKDLATVAALSVICMITSIAAFPDTSCARLPPPTGGGGGRAGQDPQSAAAEAVMLQLYASETGLLQALRDLIVGQGALIENRIECPAHRPTYVPIPPSDLAMPRTSDLDTLASGLLRRARESSTDIQHMLQTVEHIKIVLAVATRHSDAAAREQLRADKAEIEVRITAVEKLVAFSRSVEKAQAQLMEAASSSSSSNAPRRRTHHDLNKNCSCCPSAETVIEAAWQCLGVVTVFPDLFLEAVRLRIPVQQQQQQQQSFTLADTLDFLLSSAVPVAGELYPRHAAQAATVLASLVGSILPERVLAPELDVSGHLKRASLLAFETESVREAEHRAVPSRLLDAFIRFLLAFGTRPLLAQPRMVQRACLAVMAVLDQFVNGELHALCRAVESSPEFLAVKEKVRRAREASNERESGRRRKREEAEAEGGEKEQRKGHENDDDNRNEKDDNSAGADDADGLVKDETGAYVVDAAVPADSLRDTVSIHLVTHPLFGALHAQLRLWANRCDPGSEHLGLACDDGARIGYHSRMLLESLGMFTATAGLDDNGDNDDDSLMIAADEGLGAEELLFLDEEDQEESNDGAESDSDGSGDT